MIDNETSSLKPLTVSQILDNTFRVYKNNFAAIMIFSAAIGGFFILITSLLTWQSMPSGIFSDSLGGLLQDPDMFSSPEFNTILDDIWPQMLMFQGLIGLLSIISAIFINPLIHGGIINIAYHDIKGERLDYQTGLRSTLKKYWNLVTTGLALIPYYIVVFIVIMIVVVILLIPLIFLGIAMSGEPTGGIIAGFILMLFIFIVGIIILSLFSNILIVFVYPVVIAEKNYNFKAIGRSFKLVMKNFWRVIGINFVILLIVGIIGSICIHCRYNFYINS